MVPDDLPLKSERCCTGLTLIEDGSNSYMKVWYEGEVDCLDRTDSRGNIKPHGFGLILASIDHEDEIVVSSGFALFDKDDSDPYIDSSPY